MLAKWYSTYVVYGSHLGLTVPSTIHYRVMQENKHVPSNLRWPFVLITSQIESYMAVRLKDEDLRDSRQEAAKHFIHSCLYGSDSKRTTGNFLMGYVCLSLSFSQWQSSDVWFFPLVNKFLSLNNKRSPVKKAAAQFLTSTWGKIARSSVGFSSFYK